MAIAVALPVMALLGGAAWLYTPDKPAAELDARYLRKPSDMRAVSGLHLHVRDTGSRDAPVLILLHGFGASLQTWEPWAVRLQAHYRVIRFDLPGFGLTGQDPTGDYTDARSVHVLLALMDQLRIPRATLIGNSLGGKIAWNTALDHPERVERLVLVSPDGFASPGFEYGRRAKLPLLMQLLPYVMPRAMLRSSLVPAYGNPKHLTDAVVTRYRDLMLAPGVRTAMLVRMQQVMLQDPVPLLRRIRAPTLLLWGDRDGMIPVGNAQDYLEAMPNATLVTLPGLGHVPFEEAPDRSLAPVLEFLTSPRS